MLASLIERGEQGESLPGELTVLRVYKPPENYEEGKILPAETFAFTLSGTDRKMSDPKLSAYVAGMTTDEQACALVGSGNTHRLIARLKVDAIRSLRLHARPAHCLDVVWDKAMHADGSDDTRPGAEGHVGMTGLKKPPGLEDTEWRTFKALLARLVGTNYTILPEIVPKAPEYVDAVMALTDSDSGSLSAPDTI